jgi:hypothetical protein
MCRSHVESVAEWRSLAEVRDDAIETDAVYQTDHLDNYHKEQTAIFYIHVLNEAADQLARRSLLKYCCQVSIVR